MITRLHFYSFKIFGARDQYDDLDLGVKSESQIWWPEYFTNLNNYNVL